MPRGSVKMHRMRLARGVVICLAAAVSISAPAGPAWADATVSTDATSTTAGTTPAAATTATDTTATAPETTDAGTTTGSTVATGAGAAIPVSQPIDQGCVFGGVVLLLPHHAPLLIGPVADAPSAPVAAMSNLLYPADGSVVTAANVALRGSGCSNGRPAGGKTVLQALSLFGGAVTADTVGLTIADAGATHADAISGLQVDGAPLQAQDGTQVPLGTWGYLVTGTVERFRTPAASGTEPPPLRVQASALAVHLLQTHAGLPAGTELLISFAGLPGPVTQEPTLPPQMQTASPTKVTAVAPKTETTQAQTPQAKRTTHKGHHHAPFKITPPLGSIHYVFPVTGDSSFVDTYGAFRSDVPGNWHHGDDIFAALGTPVVAVADGTVNRVGWQKVGGWRIWVVDNDGNWFYYAHLSGYAPTVIHSKTVKAGEVIGFIGNSGDAFTTSPHLHFEIHPSGLRHYGYDGAVDPTRYLDGWSHLQHVRAPRPVHPRLPKAAAARQEARYVFRELLAARGLLKKPTQPAVAQPPRPSLALHRDEGAIVASAATSPKVVAIPPAASPAVAQALPATTTALAVGGSLLLLALSGATLAVRRLRRRPRETGEARDELADIVPAEPDEASSPAPAASLRPTASVTARPSPRSLPISVVAGTGSLALVTASVLLLRKRSARTRRSM
jgi:murein DD-endopeptidase MepM/ murein hydrolase activator NlpD